MVYGVIYSLLVFDGKIGAFQQTVVRVDYILKFEICFETI